MNVYITPSVQALVGENPDIIDSAKFTKVGGYHNLTLRVAFNVLNPFNYKATSLLVWAVAFTKVGDEFRKVFLRW